MSHTQMLSAQPRYSPLKDVLVRHEGAAVKGKKMALSGSGRAWREDEEAYLLQTRLQKMPYKHIAAHLNKTELACRLHYHQLSHGSARRKRATSCSSGASDAASGLAGVSAPSGSPRSKSSSSSPTMGMPTPPPTRRNVQLPSIVAPDGPARLPAMLPRAESMGPRLGGEETGRYGLASDSGHAAGRSSLPMSRSSTPLGSLGPPLRLDCDTSPRYSPSTRFAVEGPTHGAGHVDLGRLQAIYEAHSKSFWTAVADDYGANTAPMALEQAWKTGCCCPRAGGGSGARSNSSPLTPSGSPAGENRRSIVALDKTRISSLLGVDMEPMAR